MVPSARNPDDRPSVRTEYCLLGPVSARVGGEAVPVGGPRQAAVLARLLLNPRQVVSLDQFIDCIWDEQIPNRPEVAIRSYVSNLRRLLEPERRDRGSVSSLMSVSAGYRLDVDPDQIDWVRFEGAVNSARSQLRMGHHGEAATSLGLTRELWQGEPLSGVPESEYFLAHRTRLEELRAVARELTYEAQLALGDHLSVAADIDQAISVNPFRERLTELGMIALYRSGRQSAALALGQQLRERLVDSLGIDPSPRIANIELQILNHDPALREQATPPPTADKRREQPVRRMARPEGTIGDGGGDDTAEELESPRTALIRRPRDDTLLFGRRAELSEIKKLSDRLRRHLMAVAVVTGEPGIGKTALLERAGAELAGPRGRVLRCAGTDLAGDSFSLWRQLIEDLIAPSSPAEPPLITIDTAGLEPLRALDFRVGPDGLATDRSNVPRPSRPPDNGRIIAAIGDLIDRVAAQQPLAILVDDVQLADQQSVDTLRHLVTRPNRPPIAVLIAWQQALLPPEEPHGLRELSVLPHGLRLSLRGLDQSAVRQLAAVRGRTLSEPELRRLHRGAGGNPALTIEMLASGSSTEDRPIGTTPSITETIVGQATKIGPDAPQILAVAGVFDGPFTLSWLQDVLESPPEGAPAGGPVPAGRCRDVIRHSVYRGLVTELPELGWFAFRHQVVRRTLTDTLLTIDRAWYHGNFGRRFLRAGDNGHALYHLARSSDHDDRRRALLIGLELCTDVPRDLPVGDTTLRSLESLAREQLHGAEGRGSSGALACRSALFLGWRANQRGDRAAGRRWAHTAAEAAMAGLEQARQGGRIAATISDAIGDLGAAALNLTGFSPHPQPGGQLNVERDGKSLDLLEQAVAELPESDEVVPVLEIELEWLTGSFRPSDASLKKATSLLEQAIKSSKANVSAMATAIFLRRFGRVVPPERWIELTRTAVTVQTTIRERLMLAFLEHRALLEIGLDEEAERLIRTVAGDSERVGNQADAGAARTLAIRHHLWIGDLHSAARLLNDGPSDDPDRRHDGGQLVTVDVEQRAELGRLLARNNLLDAVMEELGQSPVDPATGAALLSQAGRYEQAADLLEQAIEDLSTGREQPVDAATMARIAVAANVLLHEQAAATVVEPLQRLGDELLVTNNSAVLLGPASYYAGLAAHTIGRHRQANEALDSAVVASLSKGGKPMAIQTLVAQAKLAADCTERDDVESLLRQAKELAVGLDIHWLDVQVV